MATAFRTRLTLTAQAMLAAVRDRRIQGSILDRIAGLARDPDAQGKPLLGELRGLRSIRAAGQRYRIIYRVHREQIEVLVIAIGIRREADREDIYRLAQRLLRLGLLQ